MAIIEDDSSSRMEQSLALRLRTEREERGWSLADLSERSLVSKAMISKVERNEASPTAVLLGRLSGAFGITLSTLLARAEDDAGNGGRVLRVHDQTSWRDPTTGYVRRAVSHIGSEPELVHVELPPDARVVYPQSAYTHLRGQCIWMLSGRLLFREGQIEHQLKEGDCLTLGAPTECEFANLTDQPSIYLIALARR